MAFTMYSEEQDEWGYLYESAWGTANADGGAYKRIKFPKGTKIDYPTRLTDLEMNRSVRQTVGSDIHVDNFTGPFRITVPELLVTKDRLADLLYACLQNKVSEGGAAIYLKQFKVHATQPDFTNNAGYFFTLAWDSPVTAKGIKFTSCIVKEMEISFDKGGTGSANLVRIRNLVILAMKASTGVTLSGTWVDQGTTYFNSYDYTYKYNDATAMEWIRFSIKLDNGAEILDRNSDGTPKTFFLNWPKAGGMTAEAVHWYNANTTGTIVDLLADFVAGTQRLYSIQSSANNSTTGHFKISFYGKITEPPFSAENKQLMAPVKFQLEHESAATNNLVIIDLADSVDQTP